MFRVCACLIVAATFWRTGPVVLADELSLNHGPMFRVFASAYGHFWVRASQPDYPRLPTARIELLTGDNAGSEKLVWKADIPFTPERIVVSDYGSVVLLNQLGRAGYDHAVAVMDATGKIIADYSLTDLLKEKEIKSHTQQTASSRFWLSDASFDFTKDALAIRLNWKKVITINLLTGKLAGSR
jgi:hypothetical protein